jgi:single-strand DNA-binding protein
MNLNKIFLIGNLTRDPESRTLPSGQSVSNFGLATNRVWADAETKEKKQQVEFHNVVAFGRLAEICNQYLKKGKLVFIEGRIQTRNWQGQNGETKYRTEIVIEGMQMGPRKPEQATEKETPGAPAEGTTATEPVEEIQVDEAGEEIKTEDIPF